MIDLRRPSRQKIAALFEAAKSMSPNYREVGATADADLPNGYRHSRYLEPVGPGELFSGAVQGLRQWAAHGEAGITIFPAEVPIALGATLIVSRRIGPLHLSAPCRIVRVIDETNCYGFAYGTLPGHPERGEEAFIIDELATKRSLR